METSSGPSDTSVGAVKKREYTVLLEQSSALGRILWRCRSQKVSVVGGGKMGVRNRGGQ